MSSIKVPPLGESIVEATISRWLKREGDAVAAGDTLVELETDKITVEVPALEAGVLTKRHKSEGDVVNVGDALGEIAAACDFYDQSSFTRQFRFVLGLTPGAYRTAAPRTQRSGG